MKIITVMLIKNEDIFLSQVISCIYDFSDRIILIDNGSTDKTLQIAAGFAKVEIIREPDLKKTHRIIQDYTGTNTWIFGVDGDEIYDPEGLRVLRWQISEGLYDGACHVQGWYFHATEIKGQTVTGYMGPPSHHPAKLYNMNNISSWKQDGKHILFLCRPRIDNGVKLRALPDTWEETPMRCIHTRFLRRSSQEPEEQQGRRLNGEDVLGFGNRSDRGGSDKVNERLIYRKGNIFTEDIKWLNT